jgi:hypothetical protein
MGTPCVSGSWQAKLQTRLTETLQAFTQVWDRNDVDINVDVDWSFVTRVELLRAAYSFDMFDSEIRRGALRLALS